MPGAPALPPADHRHSHEQGQTPSKGRFSPSAALVSSCTVYLLSRTFSRSLAAMVLSTCKDIRWCAKIGTYCSADSSIKRFTSCRSKPSSCKTQGELPGFTLEKQGTGSSRAGWQHGQVLCSFLPPSTHFASLGTLKLQSPAAGGALALGILRAQFKTLCIGKNEAEPSWPLMSATAPALQTGANVQQGQSSDHPVVATPAGTLAAQSPWLS